MRNNSVFIPGAVIMGFDSFLQVACLNRLNQWIIGFGFWCVFLSKMIKHAEMLHLRPCGTEIFPEI